MKRILYTYLLLFGLTAWAQGPEALFQQANDAYKKGDYQTAVSAYEKVLQSGKEAPELYFNMANAYYKLNKIAPSIYYYEKALQLAPSDEDIAYNLALANKMKIDKIDKVPENFFLRLRKNMAHWFSSDAWAKIAVFFAFLGLILFVIFLFNKQTHLKRLTFVGMFVSLFMLLFSLYNANFAKHLEQVKYAIIFVPETELRNEPNLTADKVVTLHEGTKVRLEKTEGNWAYVKLPDGKKAWIPASDVRFLSINK